MTYHGLLILLVAIGTWGACGTGQKTDGVKTTNNNLPTTKQVVLPGGFSQQLPFQYRFLRLPVRNGRPQFTVLPFRHRRFRVRPGPVSSPRQASTSTQSSLLTNYWRIVTLLFYDLFTKSQNQAMETTTSAITSTTAAQDVAMPTRTLLISPATASTTTKQKSDCGDWGSWTECMDESQRYRARLCSKTPEAESEGCQYRCGKWGQWSECSTNPILVDQTMSRQRECIDIGNEEATLPCHPPGAVGATSDGWYRAGNGYEYFFSLDTFDSEEAYEEACENLHSAATLATVGVRDHSLLLSIDFTTFDIDISSYYWEFHVNARRIDTDSPFEFSDGFRLRESDISNWGLPGGTVQPDSRYNCLSWGIQQPEKSIFKSGYTTYRCTGLRYICEKNAE